MNKGVKIAILIGTIGLTGTIGYLVYKKIKDAKEEAERKRLEEEANNNQNVTPPPTNTNNSGSGSGSGEKTPFKNNTEGNAFRKWLNDNYPKFAKDNDISTTGAYDNSFIRIGWKKYGEEYNKRPNATTIPPQLEIFITRKAVTPNDVFRSANGSYVRFNYSSGANKIKVNFLWNGTFNYYTTNTSTPILKYSGTWKDGGREMKITTGDKKGKTYKEAYLTTTLNKIINS
jgi:hypothetical protein